MGWAGDLQAEDGGEDNRGPQPDSDHVMGEAPFQEQVCVQVPASPGRGANHPPATPALSMASHQRGKWRMNEQSGLFFFLSAFSSPSFLSNADY